MDYNEIQNDKLQEAIIKVETLQKEYEVTLQQYQESTNNYVNTLDTNDKNTFVALKGRSWWGSSGLKEGTVETQNQCESMCAADAKCTGATFNPVKKYCWTRGGDGKLSPGDDNDYALLTKQKSALELTNSLNDKLISINTQMTTLLKDMEPDVNEQKKEIYEKQQTLDKSYQKLLENKLDMETQLQEYYSIDQENEKQSLFVTQKNTVMRFWMLITCLALLFTIRKMYGAERLPFLFVFWLIIVIIMLILSYSLRTPSGFMFVLIFIVLVILIYTQ
jgi:hypothetical protein